MTDHWTNTVKKLIKTSKALYKIGEKLTDKQKLDIAIKALKFYAEQRHIEDYFGKEASFGGGMVCKSGLNPQEMVIDCGQTAETALNQIKENQMSTIWHNDKKYPESGIIVATRANPDISNCYALYEVSNHDFDRHEKFKQWALWVDVLNQEYYYGNIVESQSDRIEQLEKALDVAKQRFSDILSTDFDNEVAGKGFEEVAQALDKTEIKTITKGDNNE